MDAKRYNEGIPLAEYIQKSAVRDRVLRRLRDIDLPEDVSAFFRNLPAQVRAVVITEDWCPAAPFALAMLAHCGELSNGRLEARVFMRETNPDLMDQYLKEGRYRSIPVVAFFDEAFRPLGDIREKPVLPEWEGLSRRERRMAELRTHWSELWGRAYKAIIANARMPSS